MKKTYADEFLEMAEKTSQGKWHVKGEGIKKTLSCEQFSAFFDSYSPDAEFCAYSHNYGPELARRLNKACKALRSGCAWYCSDDAYKCSLCKAADELEAPMEGER